jgi:hypothetical protein
MRTLRPVLKLATVLAALWVIAPLLLPCGSGNGIARRTQLLADAVQLRGRELTLEELQGAVGRMRLDIGVTRYTPDIQYRSATNWTVRLTAQLARAYAAELPTWYRVLIRNFSRADYLIIEVSSADCPITRLLQ